MFSCVPVIQIVGKPALPPATQYGYMLDYLYTVNSFENDGVMGSNIARRRRWTQGVYIYARPYTEAEMEAHVTTFSVLGVFIVHTDQPEIEFELDPDDMQATDWLIGTRI